MSVKGKVSHRGKFEILNNLEEVRKGAENGIEECKYEIEK
jgi:hypothetical protein